MATSKIQPEIKPEGFDLYKQYVNILEKKIRNLEKRKAKLDDYKKKQSSGTELNDDQKQAVACYAEVLALLETLNDLHKSYVGINGEISRFNKKQLKKQKLEKEQEQQNVSAFILKVYYLLTALQIPNIKKNVLSFNKDVEISSQEFDVLDKIYLHVFNFGKSNIGKKFTEYLSQASEIVLSLFTSKSTSCLDSTITFDKIKSVIDKLNLIDFFNSPQFSINIPVNEVSSKIENAPLSPSQKSISNSSEVLSSDDNDAVLLEKPTINGVEILNQNYNHLPISHGALLPSNPGQNSNVGLGHAKVGNATIVDVQNITKSIENFIQTHQQDASSAFHHPMNVSNSAPKSPFNMAANHAATLKVLNEKGTPPQARTINDLLASFQSNFNFVQDSIIETGGVPGNVTGQSYF